MTREHLHWCAINIGKGCNCHGDELDVKPLPATALRAGRLTSEDEMIFAAAFRRGPSHRCLYHMAQLADLRDAELMLSVTTYPYMLGTALALVMNPNFKMPRPLARIAPKFYDRSV